MDRSPDATSAGLQCLFVGPLDHLVLMTWSIHIYVHVVMYTYTFLPFGLGDLVHSYLRICTRIPYVHVSIIKVIRTLYTLVR